MLDSAIVGVSTMMERWGAFVARRAGRVLVVSLLAVVAAAMYGVGVFGSLANGPGSKTPKQSR